MIVNLLGEIVYSGLGPLSKPHSGERPVADTSSLSRDPWWCSCASQAIGVGELEPFARKTVGRETSCPRRWATASIVFSSAWEPESSDDEVDQTENTQDPLTYPSRPLSQSTSEVTRLVPRPKGVAKSSSSSSKPSVASGPHAKASQVTISRSKSSFESSPKG